MEKIDAELLVQRPDPMSLTLTDLPPARPLPSADPSIAAIPHPVDQSDTISRHYLDSVTDLSIADTGHP